jgi:hypothetical protein
MFLSVLIRVIRGLFGCEAALSTAAESSQLWPGSILDHENHVAEQGRCTEPPFALGTGALEF